MPIALEPLETPGEARCYLVSPPIVLPRYGSGWQEKFDQMLRSLAVYGVVPERGEGAERAWRTVKGVAQDSMICTGLAAKP